METDDRRDDVRARTAVARVHHGPVAGTYDRAVADAKAALGEQAFAEAWARGEAMTTDEIVAFAQGK